MEGWKRFDVYRRFRLDFDSLNAFLDWYNDRPHGRLNFDKIETIRSGVHEENASRSVFRNRTLTIGL
jgi:putative transposase